MKKKHTIALIAVCGIVFGLLIGMLFNGADITGAVVMSSKSLDWDGIEAGKSETFSYDLGSETCDVGWSLSDLNEPKDSLTINPESESGATGVVQTTVTCGNGLADCQGFTITITTSNCAEACADADGDGFQDSACGGQDCNDADGAVNPDAAEVCDDGIDNNCNGDTDCSDSACSSAEVCDAGPEECTENWDCTEWEKLGECVDNEQEYVRTCTDANACGTTASKPSESDKTACSDGTSDTPDDNVSALSGDDATGGDDTSDGAGDTSDTAKDAASDSSDESGQSNRNLIYTGGGIGIAVIGILSGIIAIIAIRRR